MLEQRLAMQIEILRPNAPRVQALLAQTPDVIRTFLSLLWRDVECVAVAQRGGVDVGLATLQPEDDGNPEPRVAGLWVAPEARRQGIGTELLWAVVVESQRRYGHKPLHLLIHSAAGERLARRLLREGAPLRVHYFPLYDFDLPGKEE